MHYNYWSIHIKHYNLKTVLPYGYWLWEQKLSKKQRKLSNTEIMHYTGCCVANFTPYGPPPTWEETTTIKRWRRQNIRRGPFAVKTNEHKTKIYCNIYTTGIDVNQNYMVNSNNLFCSLYKNSLLPISDKWTPSLAKSPSSSQAISGYFT